MVTGPATLTNATGQMMPGYGHASTTVTPTAVDSDIQIAAYVNGAFLATAHINAIELTIKTGDDGEFIDRVRHSTTPAAMQKDRIPPRTGTGTWVEMTGQLAANQTLVAKVVNGDEFNGTAGFRKVQNAQTFTVPGGQGIQLAFGAPDKNDVSTAPIGLGIVGIKQTFGGFWDNLKLTITDGDVKNPVGKETAPFSVSAIPYKIVMAMKSIMSPQVTQPTNKPPGATHKVTFGAKYKLTILSDSGLVKDLDSVTVIERVINTAITDSTGTPNKGFWVGLAPDVGDSVSATKPLVDDMGFTKFETAQTDQQASDQARTFTVNRSNQSLGGKMTFDQYIEFSDNRTGSSGIIIPQSGFKHVFEVVDPTTFNPPNPNEARIKVTKTPSAVTDSADNTKTALAGGRQYESDSDTVLVVVTKP